MLIAAHVVLDRIVPVLNIQVMKISFGFITVIIAAGLFGPIEAMLVGGLSDFIGAMLFPIGAYYFPFTITAALAGLIYGLVFKKGTTLPYICVGVLLNQLICSLLLNTLFISLMYDKLFLPLLATRFVSQVLIMSAVKIILTFVLFKSTKGLKSLKRAIS